jgi:NAD(P)-dependent dehydrogenase (short-subunit alcohol dehydrogenase family)
MPRKALVTGAASGLGFACAARLTADGYEVITVDLAGGCDFTVDVADPGQIAMLAARVGAISVLVNSAGIVGPNKPFWELNDSEWLLTFAVNLHGTFNLCRAFAPGMMDAGWGRIVNIASIAGKEGNPHLAAYSASKAAVIGLTKSMGKELATTGVLVNAIAPAVIETPMNQSTAPDVLASLISKIPMGRVGLPREVAALVSWLSSDECSFSTGAVYDISGGRATY